MNINELQNTTVTVDYNHNGVKFRQTGHCYVESNGHELTVFTGNNDFIRFSVNFLAKSKVGDTLYVRTFPSDLP